MSSINSMSPLNSKRVEMFKHSALDNAKNAGEVLDRGFGNPHPFSCWAKFINAFGYPQDFKKNALKELPSGKLT